jgi:hypothetical protein
MQHGPILEFVRLHYEGKPKSMRALIVLADVLQVFVAASFQ